jgi:hypothetical protein
MIAAAWSLAGPAAVGVGRAAVMADTCQDWRAKGVCWQAEINSVCLAGVALKAKLQQLGDQQDQQQLV